MWLSGANAMKAMDKMKLPEEHWLKFDLWKIKRWALTCTPLVTCGISQQVGGFTLKDIRDR